MFVFNITTVSGTTKASPLLTELPLVAGVIEQVQLAFPPGPEGLLHVVIEQGGAALWPRNGDDGFAWNSFTVDFRPLFKLTTEPTLLHARTWNDDDFYDHQVTVRFNIIPEEVAFPPREDLGILRRMERLLFGR